MEKSIKQMTIPAGTLRAEGMKQLAAEVFQYQYFSGMILRAEPCDVPFYGMALSLMLKNFRHPIVFYTEDSQQDEAEFWAAQGVSGVFALGAEGLTLACRTTYSPQTGLHSPHYPPVTQAQPYPHFRTELIQPEETDPFLMCDAMNDRLLVCYPEDDILSRLGECTFSGVHISIDGEQDLNWLFGQQMPALIALRRRNIPVVVTGLPKELREPIHRRQLLLSGVISAGDMTREAAMVKLMWTLARTASPDGVKIYFTLSFAGEVTQR